MDKMIMQDENYILLRSLARKVGLKQKGLVAMLRYYTDHQNMSPAVAIAEAIDWLEDPDGVELMLRLTNAEAWDSDEIELGEFSGLADLWSQKMELCQERADKMNFVHRYLANVIVEASDWRIREVLYTVRGEDEVIELYSDLEMTSLTRRLNVTKDSLAEIVREVAAVL